MAADASRSWITHDITPPGGSAGELGDREWLLTNGTGAYAMGTLPGANTRRYHGLLVAATRPPVGRILAVNQMLEQLVLRRGRGESAIVSVNQGPKKSATGSAKKSRSQTSKSVNPPGQSPDSHTPLTLEFSSLIFRNDKGREIHSPAGLNMLQRFTRGLSVTWTYRWGDIEFERELYLHWKEQAATLTYRVAHRQGASAGPLTRLAAGGSPPSRLPGDSATGRSVAAATSLGEGLQATLRLWPMLTLRDFHGMAHRAVEPAIKTTKRTDHVLFKKGEVAATISSEGKWVAHPDLWWYNVCYPIDAQRGQDSLEDYAVPGCFEIDLDLAKPAEITCTMALGNRPAEPRSAGLDDRHEHLRPSMVALGEIAGHAPVVKTALAIAADDFIIDRVVNDRDLKSIIAGYPWFADWGRDTFIALPGLLLCTHRFDDARAVLFAYSQFIRDGLVPNVFDDYDSQAAHYNTVDASLWFIRAALLYVQESGDRDAWEDSLCDACLKIMEAYIHGTKFSIRMSGDGLIFAGNFETQLTWMDAACPGLPPFTPRPGKCVEINALWYHALTAVSQMLAPAQHPSAPHFAKLADRVRRSFAKMFWNEERQCLNDCVWNDEAGGERVDSSMRPNQIFAASLPFSPIPRTRQVQVVAAVKQHLLTPVGLRTLPVWDGRYQGRYAGPQHQRDQAYHQGTVWPWLIGPYAEAVLRAGAFSDASRTEAAAALTPLLDHLTGPGLGQLPEIAEADAPHGFRGCPAQAWSVGELIRVLKLIKQGE